jgi:acetoin utilization protein AcuB
MGTDVVTVAPNQTIAEAARLLKDHKIRRLPVVEGQLLVGIVSPNDLGKAMPSILDAQGGNEEEFIADHTEIKAVMTESPITVGPDDTLVEAARKMRRNKIDGLPVVENRKLVGILSISDILDAFLEIMATDRPGTRFDLKIDHEPESFYKMIKAFQKQHKEILAITQFYDFSKEHQMLTIQISGVDNEALIDMLWANNVSVDRISPSP